MTLTNVVYLRKHYTYIVDLTLFGAMLLRLSIFSITLNLVHWIHWHLLFPSMLLQILAKIIFYLLHCTDFQLEVKKSALKVNIGKIFIWLFLLNFNVVTMQCSGNFDKKLSKNFIQIYSLHCVHNLLQNILNWIHATKN